MGYMKATQFLHGTEESISILDSLYHESGIEKETLRDTLPMSRRLTGRRLHPHEFSASSSGVSLFVMKKLASICLIFLVFEAPLGYDFFMIAFIVNGT